MCVCGGEGVEGVNEIPPPDAWFGNILDESTSVVYIYICNNKIIQKIIDQFDNVQYSKRN